MKCPDSYSSSEVVAIITCSPLFDVQLHLKPGNNLSSGLCNYIYTQEAMPSVLTGMCSYIVAGNNTNSQASLDF
jgi:hypothetical protein